MNTLKTMAAAAALMLVAGAAQAQYPVDNPWPQIGECIRAGLAATAGQFPGDPARQQLSVQTRCVAEEAARRDTKRAAEQAKRDAWVAEQRKQQEQRAGCSRLQNTAEDEYSWHARCAKIKWDATAPERQAQREQAEADNQRRLVEQQAVRAEREKARRAAVAENETYQQAHGYKPTAFDDFVLDGRKLAASEAKVAVKGIYKKVGQMTALFPDGMTVLQQRWNAGMPVLIDDDTKRGTREFLLHCDRDIAERGCQITLLGHATLCTVTNLAGSQARPCIKLEDGWNVGDP
jgi:hypothetical protein